MLLRNLLPGLRRHRRQKSVEGWRNPDMSERKEDNKTKSEQGDKSQEIVPPGRERVNQGQQFDEMQRQHKNPDGTARDEEES